LFQYFTIHGFNEKWAKMQKFTNNSVAISSNPINACSSTMNILSSSVVQLMFALPIGVHISTLYRELERNENKRGGYSWRLAHEMAGDRKERLPGNRATPEWIKQKVLGLIREDWSPKLILGQDTPSPHQVRTKAAPSSLHACIRLASFSHEVRSVRTAVSRFKCGKRGRFVLHRSHGIRCCYPCFEAKEERRKSEEQPIKSPQNTLVEQKFRRAKYPIPENGRYEKEIRHLKTGLHRKLRIKSECNLPKK
jgi:hypothetical protein